MSQMAMSPVQEARDLRAAHWNINDRISFPIDPHQIARSLDITVHEVDLPANTAGFIIREAGGSTNVFLNQADAPVRKRFTLAHELGHYVQHRDEESLGFVDLRNEMSSTGVDPNEVWANRFAAELLMPAAAISQWWAEGEAVDTIRKRLDVSEPALAYRLRNLGLS